MGACAAWQVACPRQRSAPVIRRAVRAALALACCFALPAAHAAEAPVAAELQVRDCLTEAAATHRLSPAMLVVLLNVESGALGRVSRNTNGTVDIGPMQVNTIWVPKIAAHWNTAPAAAYAALRDNLCANLEGGAWILRQAMDEARGDLWGGVGIYHSHNPRHSAPYLRQVLKASLLLQAQAQRLPAPAVPQVARPEAPSHLASRN